MAIALIVISCGNQNKTNADSNFVASDTLNLQKKSNDVDSVGVIRVIFHNVKGDYKLINRFSTNSINSKVRYNPLEFFVDQNLDSLNVFIAYDQLSEFSCIKKKCESIYVRTWKVRNKEYLNKIYKKLSNRLDKNGDPYLKEPNCFFVIGEYLYIVYVPSEFHRDQVTFIKRIIEDSLGVKVL